MFPLLCAGISQDTSAVVEVVDNIFTLRGTDGPGKGAAKVFEKYILVLHFRIFFYHFLKYKKYKTYSHMKNYLSLLCLC